MIDTRECRHCGLTRPIAELFIPDGSLVIDTSPPIYEYLCVDRERCCRDKDDFDGCSRPCRKRGKHTLKWGDCKHGVRPEPTLGFFHTFVTSDGDLSGVTDEIPAAALLPWVKHLTTDQRWDMLKEAAHADDPAAVIARWRRRADARAPVQINMPPAREPNPGYGPAHLHDAYELGRRQGRYEADG